MIIVTGATGFVGQRLAPKLIKKFGRKNILFLVYDKDPERLPHTSREFLKRIGANVKYIDLTRKSTLKGLPKNPSLVIHLAANTNTALPDHKVNDIGTKNFYNALGKLDKKTHIIHVGTMVAVSGRPDCKKPIDEDSTDYPTNEYTRTKTTGENYILEKCRKDKFRLTILRPNTIYGKGMRKGSLFDMLKNEIDNNSIVSRLNWPGKSALIHVDDVAKNIIKFTDKYPRPGIPEKYLLYSENLSISQLNKIISNAMKIPYKPINLPKPIWRFFSFSRRFVPFFEPLLPPGVYNQIWRASIIVDDVIYCNSNRVSTRNNKMIRDHILEVLN